MFSILLFLFVLRYLWLPSSLGLPNSEIIGLTNLLVLFVFSKLNFYKVIKKKSLLVRYHLVAWSLEFYSRLICLLLTNTTLSVSFCVWFDASFRVTRSWNNRDYKLCCVVRVALMFTVLWHEHRRGRC